MIDFMDLNKACHKDSFPLSMIYMLVDMTAGHEMLSFLNAFSSNNQIFIDPYKQKNLSHDWERDVLRQSCTVRTEDCEGYKPVSH